MFTNTAILWAARGLGILAGLFLGMFALDAFGHGKPVAAALTDFAVHLIPAALLLSLVWAGWRRPWIAAVGFGGLAVLYAVTVGRSRPDWALAISGPLLVTGSLFLLSWFRRQPGE